MTEDIIFQSETDKQDINQISEQKFQNLTDFELKILQRVRFWIKNFTTRQIFSQNIYNASDFDERFFLKSMIVKKKIFLKSTILKQKKFLKSLTLNKKLFLKSMILNKKFLWKDWFSIKFLSSCQILN